MSAPRPHRSYRPPGRRRAVYAGAMATDSRGRISVSVMEIAARGVNCPLYVGAKLPGSGACRADRKICSNDWVTAAQSVRYATGANDVR